MKIRQNIFHFFKLKKEKKIILLFIKKLYLFTIIFMK